MVSGGIAAYKSAYLARRLIEAGSLVDVVLTGSAQRFIGSVTFEGITGRPVHADLWERPMAHLDLGKAADLALVAPGTANLISRLARGAAEDLATTTLLAADCPVIVAPAMNTRMWEHPATRANVARLAEYGYEILGPAVGALAEGETGEGRMVEPEEIISAAGRRLEPASALTGIGVVVTAGPTRTDVDPVRYVTNRSSGRMGYSLAAAAWRRGADVTLITGPGRAPRPHGPRVVEVETAREMLDALETALSDARILLMAAAVGDFEVPAPAASKIKKDEDGLDLVLRPGPDLLIETRAVREARGIFTLGFALETEDGVENGLEKLSRKGMQLVAVNLAGEPGAGFEVETNRVTLLDDAGVVEELPLLPKDEVAERLLDRVADAIER